MSPGLARKPGDRVGPFEIVEYLASGGMGDVYVGRDTRESGPDFQDLVLPSIVAAIKPML